MPWLNRFDKEWLKETIEGYKHVFILEDHNSIGGLGDHLLDACSKVNLLEGRRMVIFGVEGYPACGTPAQVLAYHQLDGISLSKRVMQYCD